MKGENIIIASVLKPVNDTRLFEKIALSLAKKFQDFQFHIVAFKSEQKSIQENLPSNLHLHPFFSFQRLGFKRLFANWLIFWKFFRLKPKLIIVCTFELLPAALSYKLFFRAKLIYDIQENYYRNLLYMRIYPLVIKQILAMKIRTLEILSQPFINLFVLAEKCYVTELSFTKNKSIVIENKCIPFNSLPEKNKTRINSTAINLVYTGTIAWDYGIFEAVHFIKALNKINNAFKLKIIGYCASKKDLLKLKSLISNLDFIQLIGGDKPLPHRQIIDEILVSNFVLLPYHINESVKNRLPTKLFECLALHKPMLLQKNEVWEKYLNAFSFKAALFIDFMETHHLQHLYLEMNNTKFYENVKQIEGIWWQEEEEKLIAVFQKFLGNS